MHLVAIIPALNEASSIGQVIRAVRQQSSPGITRLTILAVDDGSTDGTAQRAIEAGADFVVRHRMNRGLGVAFRHGLQHALDLGADVIVSLDADGQHDPMDIPRLVEPVVRGSADIVLGFRAGASLRSLPISKKMGNLTATWVARLFTRRWIKDGQSGFRAYSREAAQSWTLCSQYTYVHETIMQGIAQGLRLCQVPVIVQPRGGRSRLIPNIFHYARRAGYVMALTFARYQAGPIGIFLAGLGAIGLALLVVGLAVSWNGPAADQGRWLMLAMAPLSAAFAMAVLWLGLLYDWERRVSKWHFRDCKCHLQGAVSLDREGIHPNTPQSAERTTLQGQAPQ